MNVPEDLKYAESHEWARLEGANARVGITDHAQSELSDVVYVELSKVGDEVAVGQAVAVVESVKAASDIYSPVSGKIVEVNTALEGDPGLINTSPYENGWIFVVELFNPSDLDSLKTPAQYSEQIG